MVRTYKKVVDNKYLEMTQDEFNEFEKICRAADRPNFNGEEIFRDRFVTDDNGKIIYLKALSNKQISFEAVFFLMNLMQNQHLRAMYNEVDYLAKKINEKVKQVDDLKIDDKISISEKNIINTINNKNSKLEERIALNDEKFTVLTNSIILINKNIDEFKHIINNSINSLYQDIADSKQLTEKKYSYFDEKFKRIEEIVHSLKNETKDIFDKEIKGLRESIAQNVILVDERFSILTNSITVINKNIDEFKQVINKSLNDVFKDVTDFKQLVRGSYNTVNERFKEIDKKIVFIKEEVKNLFDKDMTNYNESIINNYNIFNEKFNEIDKIIVSVKEEIKGGIDRVTFLESRVLLNNRLLAGRLENKK